MGQYPQLRTDLLGYVPQNSKFNHRFPTKLGDVVALGSEKRGWRGWVFSGKLEKDQSRY